MSECYECKLVAMGKGRSAMCYDCLEERNVELQAELAALREAAQEKINADIDCWAANNLHEHSISNKRNELAHDKLAALLQEKAE